MKKLILASTSRYRAALLARLQLNFDVFNPQVDETPQPGELPLELSRRLATSKALAYQGSLDAWALGSDQVLDLEGSALGKPHTTENARAQLAACSGKRVDFHTAVALAQPSTGQVWTAECTTTVQFRVLRAADINNYVSREPALDCAGSFKVEGLGITLFDSVLSEDPTALEGLPLISTCRLLRQQGLI